MENIGLVENKNLMAGKKHLQYIIYVINLS